MYFELFGAFWQRTSLVMASGAVLNAVVIVGRALALWSGVMLLCSAAMGQQNTTTSSRMAMVIGNGKYPLAPLSDTVNDARMIQSALRDVGFKVQFSDNLSLAEFITEIKRFLANSAASEIRFIYFAGHGATYRGRNYLIPVDAVLKSEDELPSVAVDLHDLQERLVGMSNGISILVVDACRSMPLARSPSDDPRRPVLRGSGRASGLDKVVAPRGTLVAYSTSPGRPAGVRNSRYAKHLAAEIRKPGQPIEEVFKNVRTSVYHDTRGQQTPWEDTSLMGVFCLVPNDVARCGRETGAGQAPSVNLK